MIDCLSLEWDNHDSAQVDARSMEPDDFVYTTSGTIASSDESENQILVGKFTVHYIDLIAAEDEGQSAFGIFDAHSQGLAEYYAALFDGDEFQKKVFDALDEESYSNLLILDRLEILPEFRGNNLGLVVMRRLINRFSAGASLVAIKPFPLQFEAHPNDDSSWRQQMKLSSFSGSEKSSTEKLLRYYGRLGFVSVPATPFMVLATTSRLPAIKDLIHLHPSIRFDNQESRQL